MTARAVPSSPKQPSSRPNSLSRSATRQLLALIAGKQQLHVVYAPVAGTGIGKFPARPQGDTEGTGLMGLQDTNEHRDSGSRILRPLDRIAALMGSFGNGN